MALAKIKYEKVVGTDGVLYLKITGWKDVLTIDQLPKKYLEMYPRFYNRRHMACIRVHRSKTYYYDVWKGDEMTQDQFARFIRDLKRAGDNLTRVNRELKELRNKWHGEGEVTI